MDPLLDWLAAGRVRSIVIPIALVLVIGYGDYLSGYLLTLSFLYTLPVLAAVWARDTRFGIAVAAVASAVSVLAAHAAGLPTPTVLFPLWNALMRFAVFATVAYLMGHLKQRLEHESRKALSDPLTQIANRRALIHALEVESNRVAHSGRCFSLLFIDLDDFKALNDSAGHAAGDEALSRIAKLIVASSRVMDVTARLGGDEFCVLLPDTDELTLRAFVARLCASVEAEIAAQGWAISLSVGVVTVRNASLSADEALRAADSAMYAAKSAGKRQVCYRVLN